MTRYIYRLLGLIILALVFSCKSEFTSEFSTILIDPENSDSLINKVFESMDLKIINNRQILKSSVIQTKINDNKLFLLTEDIKNHSCKILIYEWPDLIFIDSIVSGIDGPYNIKYIKCFDVLNKRIYIMDALYGFLHVYSFEGKFTKKYNLNSKEPFIFTHFIMINDSELILDSDNAPNIEKCRLKYFNLQTNHSKVLYYNSKMPGGMSWDRFDRDRNKIYFFTNLDPYIYVYNEKKIELDKFIYLDFEGKFLLQNDLPNEIVIDPTIINDIIDKNNKIYSIYSFYKFDDIICFSFYYKNKFNIAIINLDNYNIELYKKVRNQNVNNFIEPNGIPIAKDGKSREIVFLEEIEYFDSKLSNDLKVFNLHKNNIFKSDIFTIYQLN